MTPSLYIFMPLALSLAVILAVTVVLMVLYVAISRSSIYWFAYRCPPGWFS